MTRVFKVVYCVVFFTAVLLPSLCFFGAKERWTVISGWERKAKVPDLTFASWTNRTFQSEFSENFAKKFFLRKTFLKTSFQLRDWANFKQFHYGFGGVIEGRDNIIFEKAYAKYHLECDRNVKPAKYDEVIALLREVDAYCASNGMDFVFFTMPDKLQTYEESLPRWFNWFWDYSNHFPQAKVADICRKAGIRVFDAHAALLAHKPEWKTWVFPPGGAHLNAYGMGLIYEDFLTWYAANGRLKLKSNPFRTVRPIKEIWSVDDDISLLMNTWRNDHLRTNPHYAPVFAQTNVTMNAGSAITFGDCFREQVKKIFIDAGLFASNKVEMAWRYGKDTPKHLEPYSKDLSLLVMVYQSFNTDRLYGCCDEIRNIFDCVKKGRSNSKK